MNYATQDHIGNDQSTRTETATEITPTVGRVLKMDATAKGRKSDTERQTEIRSGNYAATGILTCAFLPKLKMVQSIQACKRSVKTARDFYKSLSFLADHYSIAPMQSKDFAFPYNIALGMWDMETKLKPTNSNWNSLRLVQGSKGACLVSQERYDTGTNLYHIPVIPLFRMLQDKERKQAAQLLTSVCCYLYHAVNIPYYRQTESYLYWLYDMHTEWIEQDEETDETECCRIELREAECIGDYMEKKLFNRIHLKLFKQRLRRFESRDSFDKESHKIACEAFALYTEYPNSTIFTNARTTGKDPCEDDYREEVIRMEQYVSFVADTKGWLYDSLSETINNEFNECGAMEEPIICKQFDGGEITATTLDFENHLFALLDNLCSLLYDYKTTEK